MTPAETQLHAIVDAWEELPGGRQVRNRDVEAWLAADMAPAINAIRGFLRRRAPDGVLPPPPALSPSPLPVQEPVSAPPRLSEKLKQTLAEEAEAESDEYRLSTSKWRDIETAPKDGTRILAACEKGGDIQITWFGKTSHVPLYGWCEGEDAEDIDLWHPTHWMPLPPSPTEGQTVKEGSTE